jgi:hypothetical protein
VTANEIVFFLAGIAIGIDLALLVHFWPAIRDGRKAAKALAGASWGQE